MILPSSISIEMGFLYDKLPGGFNPYRGKKNQLDISFSKGVDQPGAAEKDHIFS